MIWAYQTLKMPLIIACRNKEKFRMNTKILAIKVSMEAPNNTINRVTLTPLTWTNIRVRVLLIAPQWSIKIKIKHIRIKAFKTPLRPSNMGLLNKTFQINSRINKTTVVLLDLLNKISIKVPMIESTLRVSYINPLNNLHRINFLILWVNKILLKHNLLPTKTLLPSRTALNFSNNRRLRILANLLVLCQIFLHLVQEACPAQISLKILQILQTKATRCKT